MGSLEDNPHTDPELHAWLTFASVRGGSFIQTLVSAAYRADPSNYAILRPVLLRMKGKYPDYQAMTEKTEPTEDPQARAFVKSMSDVGWTHLATWSVEGHVFELLMSRRGRTALVQTYPHGHGFQVWKPVTDSNVVVETRRAVESYGMDDVVEERKQP